MSAWRSGALSVPNSARVGQLTTTRTTPRFPVISPQCGAAVPGFEPPSTPQDAIRAEAKENDQGWHPLGDEVVGGLHLRLRVITAYPHRVGALDEKQRGQQTRPPAIRELLVADPCPADRTARINVSRSERVLTEN